MKKNYLDCGLEVHVQLNTKTKLFSRAPVVSTNAEANSAVAPMDLGLPGQMPNLNQKAVVLAAKIALALQSDISSTSYFDRKHYHYPDLPAGYQITQFTKSFAYGGYVKLPNGKKITITSMHLETDAAKLKYENNKTLIDYNRCGVPLLEIVFDPCMHSVEDVIETIKALQRTIKAVKGSDCDMSKGNMRIDVNMSLRENDQMPLGKRVEIKNLNSFKSIKNAIEYEMKYQKDEGFPTTETTKGFRDELGETYFMRNKESSADYRYLLEPNIPPLSLSDVDLKKIKQTMPEKLPHETLEEYLQYTNTERALVLLDNPILGNYVQNLDNKYKKNAINLLTNDILSLIKEKDLTLNQLNFNSLTLILKLLDSQEISSNIAKKKLLPLLFTKEDLQTYIEKNNLKSITNTQEIQQFIDEVKKSQPKLFEQYANGNTKILQAIKGKIMALSRGKVSPQKLNELLEKL